MTTDTEARVQAAIMEILENSRYAFEVKELAVISGFSNEEAEAAIKVLHDNRMIHKRTNRGVVFYFVKH